MVIFEDGSEQIVFKDEKYYLRTDVGHFCEKIIEIEISKEDAERVMRDVMHSIKLVQDYQNKLWGLA